MSSPGPRNDFHMSDLVITHKAPETPASLPLNEASWQAWLAKGRAAEIRDAAARVTYLMWFMAAFLLAAAALQPLLAHYQSAYRLTVGAGAALAMIAALGRRQYGFAVLFAVVALAFNLAARALDGSGVLQRIAAVAAACCFLAYLAMTPRRSSHA